MLIVGVRCRVLSAGQFSSLFDAVACLECGGDRALESAFPGL